MVWYSHLFKSFPQFVMIHTVKGFSVVNETGVDVFLEFPCLFYDQANVGNLISDLPAFAKPSLDIFYWLVVKSMLWAALPFSASQGLLWPACRDKHKNKHR